MELKSTESKRCASEAISWPTFTYNIYAQPPLYHVQSVVKCVSPHAQQSQWVLSESVRIITVSQIIRVISELGLAAEYGHMSSAMCVCEPRVDCARFSTPSVRFATVSCSGDSLWPWPCVRQRAVMWSLPMRCVLNWYFYFCFKRWNPCVWHDPDRLGRWKAKRVCSFWISILFYSFGHVH